MMSYIYVTLTVMLVVFSLFCLYLHALPAVYTNTKPTTSVLDELFLLHNSSFWSQWSFIITISCVVYLVIDSNFQETLKWEIRSDKIMWWVFLCDSTKWESIDTAFFRKVMNEKIFNLMLKILHFVDNTLYNLYRKVRGEKLPKHIEFWNMGDIHAQWFTHPKERCK